MDNLNNMNNVDFQENEERSLEIGEKIKFFFIRPRKLFEDFLSKEYYISLIAWVASASVVLSILKDVIFMDYFLDANAIEGLTTGNGSADIGLSIFQGIFSNPVTMITISIITTLVGFAFSSIIGTFFYWIFGMIFKCKADFKFYYGIYVISFIPLLIREFINFLYVLISGGYNPIPVEDLFFTSFMEFINPFAIWNIVLMIIGISVIAGVSQKRSSSMVITKYILGFLLAIGFVAIANAFINSLNMLGIMTM